jgi:hypothetical protein
VPLEEAVPVGDRRVAGRVVPGQQPFVGGDLFADDPHEAFQPVAVEQVAVASACE